MRKGYSSADLKLDLANLYQKTGLKNLGTVFLMTDAQVADEKFLVLINNLLASGEIPDLFGDDEVIDLFRIMIKIFWHFSGHIPDLFGDDELIDFSLLGIVLQTF